MRLRRGAAMSMPAFPGRRLFVAGMLAVSLALPAAAQDRPPLSIDLAASTPPVRLGDVMPTVWDIQKFQPGLMEGRIEFHLHLGLTSFYRYISDELVLHEPNHRFHWLFPPITTSLQTPEIEVDVTWHPQRGDPVPLRMQLLRIPFSAQRTMILGVAETRSFQGRRIDWDQRLEALKLESLGEAVPATQVSVQGRIAPLQTVFVTWDAASTPSDPLAYTACDVVAVGGTVFSTLRRPQLDALEAWCRAGGSLYVEPEGLLEPVHAEFLNRVTRPWSRSALWSLDRSGKLAWPVEFEESAYLAVCDLGRVVILNPAMDRSANFQNIGEFLWHWPPGLNPNEYARQAFVQNLPVYGGRGDEASLLTSSIAQTLMPSSVRIVPFPVIVTLLSTLVLIIGPLDWWWLGRLRLRRYTWITWPAWTLMAAVVTVVLSNWFLRASDVPRSLVVHDLGSDGRIVRSHEFQLVFPSRARVHATEVAQGLWQPLAIEQFQTGALGLPQRSRRRGPYVAVPGPQVEETGSAKSLPLYSGRVPSRYVAEQAGQQWVPQLSYRLHIPYPPSDREPVLDLAAINAAKWTGRESPPNELVADIKRQLGAEATVGGVVAHGRLAAWERKDQLQPLASCTIAPEERGTRSASPAWCKTIWPEFFLCSHVDPRASPVLLVARQEGETLTVYRSLSAAFARRP